MQYVNADSPSFEFSRHHEPRARIKPGETVQVEAEDALSGQTLATPRIESPTEIMTVATGCPMERSIAEAHARRIPWMEDEYSWPRWKAFDILTHVGRISVGYYALGTVAAKIEKQYLR